MASQFKGQYDVIVIGAGIEGSACAYTLAKRNKAVLLLEQFPLPHGRGSSHGHSRITRYAYDEDFYIKMMVDAFPLWEQLAAEAKKELFINCGVLDMRPKDCTVVQEMIHNFKQLGIPCERLTNLEVKKRFPAVKLNDLTEVFFDPSGGMLRADRCLQAFQSLFKAVGGVIHDEETVTSINPGDVTTVMTDKAQYTSSAVVLAAGPWSGALTSSLGLQLPLEVSRVTVCYWRCKPGSAHLHQPQSFPCCTDSSQPDRTYHVYGLPVSEYPGLVKICLHEGVVCHPDARDQVHDEDVVQRVTTVVKDKFPYLETTPAIVEHCMYTCTPDFHPIIDRHPAYPNIVIAAGFSGHGFKLAPVVGKLVSQLLCKEVPSHNMAPFRASRFSMKSNL